MKKLLFLILTTCLIISCACFVVGCEGGGDVDATLYHLTLSSNITLDENQKKELKAIYGYGTPTAILPERNADRDEDEIESLKQAGATQEDIDKAGVRQADGTYYFFEGDPIYIVAPAVEGYNLLGFYIKGTNPQYPEYKLSLGRSSDIEGGQALTRWNMKSKDVELEARYQKCTYEIDFCMDTDENNPNNITSYCFLDDGIITLEPATSTNEYKAFICWEYQDYSSEQGGWIPLTNSELPTDYDAEYMRIQAKWEIEQFTIEFAFEYYIDPDHIDDLSFEDACESIMVHSNLATVDGQLIPCETVNDKTAINKDSVLKIQYNSWMEIFITPTSQYKVWQYRINDGEPTTYYSEYGYI
ncbi:MAG: hypothetical protein KBS91_00815, partial [Firmicutes bacterium]|nr:hypothetical protein [Candidatus Caballimonas caccae]